MKLRILLYILLLCVATPPVFAAQRELTVFSDGLLVEIEVAARKGVAEVMLPAPLREGTLRVKPLDGGTVGRVELLPFRVPDKQQKELDSLTEQKSRLEDRMKALDTREDIFAAAAKSQSSKAPRKTKTNPDPLASVRQGTDFAIAQLEAVFTARRRTAQDLKRVEAKLAQLQKSVTNGPTVRIMTSAPVTRVRVAAVLAEGGWKPRYEIRLDGSENAQLVMLAQVSPLPDGFAARVSPSPVAAGQSHQSVLLPGGSLPRIAEWHLPVEKVQVVAAAIPSFSFTIKNSSGSPMLAGEAAIYSNGEYLGSAMLSEVAAGGSFIVKSR